jgi:hypothetical protein
VSEGRPCRGKDHGLPRFLCDDHRRRFEAVMAVYLVETYLSRHRARDLGSIQERLRHAGEALTRDGMDVLHVRTVFVPADETCFHLFDAASAAAVLAAGERAAIDFDRISEATYGDATAHLSAASEARSIDPNEERT